MCAFFFMLVYFRLFFSGFFLTKNFKYSGNIQLFGDTFTNNLDFLSFISSFFHLSFLLCFFVIIGIKRKRDVNCCLVLLLLLLFFLAVLFQKTQYGWWRERKRKRERENQEIKWVHGIQNTNTKTTTTKREWIENSYLNLLY